LQNVQSLVVLQGVLSDVSSLSHKETEQSDIRIIAGTKNIEMKAKL